MSNPLISPSCYSTEAIRDMANAVLDALGGPVRAAEKLSAGHYVTLCACASFMDDENRALVAERDRLVETLNENGGRGVELAERVDEINRQLSEDHEPWYITMYPHHWGRGRSPEESKRRARRQGGKGRAWVTYEIPRGARSAWVDDMGGVRWTFPEGWADEEYEAARRVPMKIVAHGAGIKKSELS